MLKVYNWSRLQNKMTQLRIAVNLKEQMIVLPDDK